MSRRWAAWILLAASPCPAAETREEKEFLQLLSRKGSTPKERREAFRALQKAEKSASKAVERDLQRSWEECLRSLDRTAASPVVVRRVREIQPRLVAAGERMQTVVKAEEVSRKDVDAVLAKVRTELDALYKELAADTEFKGASERVLELGEYCEWAKLNRGFPFSLGDTLARLAFMRCFADPAHHPVFELNHRMRPIIDPEEAECIERTNVHRLELGLRPLEIDFRLVIASRKHSEEMRDKNYFSHDSPTPKLASPWTRAGRENVRASAENISTAGSAGQAFQGWYYSAGHHRNMIQKHASSIGIGRAGKRWTEMLGSASLLGRHRSSRELEYARLRYEAEEDCRAHRPSRPVVPVEAALDPGRGRARAGVAAEAGSPGGQGHARAARAGAQQVRPSSRRADSTITKAAR